MRIVAIDPGDVHVGFAAMTDHFVMWSGEIAPDEVEDAIRNFYPEKIIIESFFLRPNKQKAQTWSQMGTPRLIGEIKAIAKSIGIEVIEQQPSVRDTINRTPYYRSAKEQGMIPKNRHAKDAVSHGLYWHYMNRKNPRFAKPKTGRPDPVPPPTVAGPERGPEPPERPRAEGHRAPRCTACMDGHRFPAPGLGCQVCGRSQ